MTVTVIVAVRVISHHVRIKRIVADSYLLGRFWIQTCIPAEVFFFLQISTCFHGTRLNPPPSTDTALVLPNSADIKTSDIT